MVIKTIKDYYDKMYELFPDVPKEDILRILKYYWRLYYLLNSYGGDTLIQARDLWFFTGYLCNDSLKHYRYYIKKLTTKLRVLYKRRKTEWDGYYYFALTDTQYEEYLKLKHHRGRPRKYFKYGNQVLYKMLDECKIQEYARKYIFKVPMTVDLGFTIYIQDYKSGDAELIITRDRPTFKDTLISNNKYELL